jgi:hypothetical protein
MFAPVKAGGGSAGPKKTSALGNRRGDYHTATATTATGITIPQNQPVMEYAFRGQGQGSLNQSLLGSALAPAS